MSGWTTCMVCYDHFWTDNPCSDICGASCLREFEEQCEIDRMEEDG
jgi:hypothetical protein